MADEAVVAVTTSFLPSRVRVTSALRLSLFLDPSAKIPARRISQGDRADPCPGRCTVYGLATKYKLVRSRREDHLMEVVSQPPQLDAASHCARTGRGCGRLLRQIHGIAVHRSVQREPSRSTRHTSPVSPSGPGK